MKEKLPLIRLLALATAFSWMPALFAAAEKKVDIFLLNDNVAQHGIGKKIGTLTLKDTDQGLLITPHLKGLPKGEHGFHVHENPACDGQKDQNGWEKGFAAGDHYDPEHTHKHLGPQGEGHRGDLPVLVVNEKGESQEAVVASRLKLAEVVGHSVIIHAGADNYSDNPPMGGSGERIACGVIK